MNIKEIITLKEKKEEERENARLDKHNNTLPNGYKGGRGGVRAGRERGGVQQYKPIEKEHTEDNTEEELTATLLFFLT